MAASIGFLKFPVTADILSAWNSGINTDLFDVSDSTMQLFFHPSQFQPIIEDLGARGIVRGFGSTVVQNPAIAQGFELTIEDSREAIIRVLETLRSANSSGTVTVHDYMYPDEADRATGYTVRTMVVNPPIKNGGALFNSGITGDRLFSAGFTVTLTEL